MNWLTRWFERKPPAPDLTPYVGQWVAIRGGRVIAHARGTGPLVADLVAMGEAGRGASLFFHAAAPEGDTNGE